MNIRFARSVFALGLAAAAALPAFSQDAPGPQPGDPARWYQPNVSAQDRYRTAAKEAGAAQDEAMKECRAMAAAQRSACVSEARSLYRSDMEAARAQNPGQAAPQKAKS